MWLNSKKKNTDISLMAFDPTIASQGMKPLFGFVVTERRLS